MRFVLLAALLSPTLLLQRLQLLLTRATGLGVLTALLLSDWLLLLLLLLGQEDTKSQVWIWRLEIT